MNMRRTTATTALLVIPGLAAAQEKITSGLQQATTWAAIVFGAAGVLAILYAAFKKMYGDPTANQHLAGVLVGGIIGLGASGIMGMLRMWFGG